MPLTATRSSSRVTRGGLVSPRIGGNTDLDAATLTYASAIARNGGSIGSADLAAVDAFVKGLKLDGLWDLFDLIWPCAGDNLAAALVCLKTQTGVSAVLTNTGPFVEADYVPTAGLTGNGSSKRLTTLTSLAATQTFGAHLSVYLTACDYSTAVDIGNNSGGTALLQPGSRGQIGSSNLLASHPGRRFGLSLQSLTGTGCVRYKGATSIASNASTFATLPSSLGLFATPGGASYSSHTLAMATAGAGLSSDQVAKFASRADAFIAAIGRKPVEPVILSDLDWVVTIGQSLARGATSTPTTLTNVGNNLMFDDPNMDITQLYAGATALAPLTEVMSVADGTTGGETHVAAFATSLNASSGRLFFSTGSPKGGAAYSVMLKGSANYGSNIGQAVIAKNIFTARGRTATIRALLNVHGENDDKGNNTSYDTNLATWQSDYETDLKAATGQSTAIPQIISQASSWTSYAPRSTPLAAQLQLAAYLANPTKTILACPKYFLPYVDTAHLTAAGYRWMGEYYAKAYYTAIVQAQTWLPLYPLSVNRSGATITAVMSRGGLVIDTTAVSDPSGTYASRTYTQGYTAATNSTVTNYQGFEFMDDTATSPSANVTGVSIGTTNISNDTLTITLSGTPTGANKRLRYAWTMTSGNNPGPTTGARGCLRDSDTSYASQYGNTLYNWCCTFDMAAT